MAIRTRASGFRASGNWVYKPFNITLTDPALTIWDPAASRSVNLVGFRIAGVALSDLTHTAPAFVEFHADPPASTSVPLAPLWVCEAGAYSGLSWMASGEFGDGLLLPVNDVLKIDTTLPLGGSGISLRGVVWGKEQ